MNNTIATEGRTDTDRIVPRAVLHKQILDTAEQRPDASMEELADEISFATTDLVERVLDEYGDPGIEGNEDEETADGETMATEETGPEHEPSIDHDDELEGDDDVSEANSAPSSVTDGTDNDAIHDETESESNDDAMIYHAGAVDHDHGPGVSTEDDSQSERQSASDVELSDLTEKQQETILAIRDRPGATQAELASELGVTSATINQRVNSIDGFDWSDRQTFVETVLERTETTSGEGVERTVNTITASVEDTMNAMSEPDEIDSSDETDSGASEDAADQQCEELTERVGQLADRLETIERRLDTQPTSVLAEPELAHKVLHACFSSDQISEEEELRILENLISG